MTRFFKFLGLLLLGVLSFLEGPPDNGVMMGWVWAVPLAMAGISALGSFMDQKQKNKPRESSYAKMRDPGPTGGHRLHALDYAMDLLHGGGRASGASPWGFMDGMGGIFNDPKLAALMAQMHQPRGDRTVGFDPADIDRGQGGGAPRPPAEQPRPPIAEDQLPPKRRFEGIE